MCVNNEEYAEVERLVNATIHELVFVAKFVEDDQVEDAGNALITAQNNLDQVATLLKEAEGRLA